MSEDVALCSIMHMAWHDPEVAVDPGHQGPRQKRFKETMEKLTEEPRAIIG